MDKREYKNAFKKIQPDKEFEERLKKRVVFRPGIMKFRPLMVGALVFVTVFMGFIAVPRLQQEKITQKKSVPGNSDTAVSEKGLYIPKIELSVSENSEAKMIGLIVYKGKIYTQSGTIVNPGRAKELLGKKIGTTTGNIDEWSTQEEYSKELASTIGETDVYEVKGYDSNFRIMTYGTINGGVFTEFFECLNGIEVKSGADIIGKLNLEGNIQSATWEKFESWNLSEQQYLSVQLDDKLNDFLDALYNAKPLPREPLMNQGIYDKGEDGYQKFLYIEQKDGNKVQLRLFKDGYVGYGFADVFFKVEQVIYDEFYHSLN